MCRRRRCRRWQRPRLSPTPVRPRANLHRLRETPPQPGRRAKSATTPGLRGPRLSRVSSHGALFAAPTLPPPTAPSSSSGSLMTPSFCCRSLLGAELARSSGQARDSEDAAAAAYAAAVARAAGPGTGDPSPSAGSGIVERDGAGRQGEERADKPTAHPCPCFHRRRGRHRAANSRARASGTSRWHARRRCLPVCAPPPPWPVAAHQSSLAHRATPLASLTIVEDAGGESSDDEERTGSQEGSSQGGGEGAPEQHQQQHQTGRSPEEAPATLQHEEGEEGGRRQPGHLAEPEAAAAVVAKGCPEGPSVSYASAAAALCAGPFGADARGRIVPTEGFSKVPPPAFPLLSLPAEGAPTFSFFFPVTTLLLRLLCLLCLPCFFT